MSSRLDAIEPDFEALVEAYCEIKPDVVFASNGSLELLLC